MPAGIPARILVAEDDPAVRQFVSRALVHVGYEVEAVEDGLGALDVLAERSFDLLISDIVMPGLDGIALALKVAKEWPELPVMLMTGYAHERQRAHNIEVLSHAVLTKPFTLDDIVAAVARILEPARSPA
ncbi:MAG: response regulator [Alphaproteobacteria bacterium]